MPVKLAMVVAEMWGGDGDHMNGGWWWVMGIGWLIFLAVVVVLGVFVVRHFTSVPRGSEGTSSPNALPE